jgi:cell division protein FtsQ
MKFWKKRDTSGARRNTKMWVSRMKRIGLYSGMAGSLVALLVYAWMSGVFIAFGDFVHEKMLITTKSVGFAVDEILVTGRKNVAQADILDRLPIKQGAPIFGVSIDTAQKEMETIPWVERASVSRRLPDKIIVHIEERVPAALWQYQKKISLIDAAGNVLSSEGIEGWKNLPLVVGEDAPNRIIELTGMLQAEPHLAGTLGSAVRIGGRRWDLHFRNGVVVKLPESNVELALRLLASTEEQKGILSKGIQVIDLRIPEKMVVEPQQASG